MTTPRLDMTAADDPTKREPRDVVRGSRERQPLTERLRLPRDGPPHLLVVGAHADDAEIGAGGTIMRLLDERPECLVTWLVVAADTEVRAAEAQASAERLLHRAGARSIEVHGLRDGFLPFLGSAPKELLLAHAESEPDLIVGPRREDAHQDHRLIAELLPQVFRHSTILEYEIPKWDGGLDAANLYVPLSTAVATAKVTHILGAFPSQTSRDWFSEDTFRALLRLRGVECRAADGWAEAFVCRKLVV